MRAIILSFSVGAAALLAACDAWETATPPPTPPRSTMAAPAPPSFEDNGCLAYLQIRRAAILDGRAQGDAAALDAPIAAWRARGAQTLSADELAQYEASSTVVHEVQSAGTIAERAEACVRDAPQVPSSAGTPPG
jgi:hypothetical protein